MASGQDAHVNLEMQIDLDREGTWVFVGSERGCNGHTGGNMGVWNMGHMSSVEYLYYSLHYFEGSKTRPWVTKRKSSGGTWGQVLD